MEGLEICNLKCSIKADLFVTFEDLSHRCKTKSWFCQKYNSYIVIKPKESLRFIIFNSQLQSQITHINLTGVRTFPLLESALELLSNFLDIPQTYMRCSLDNISGKSEKIYSLIHESSVPKKTINLHNLLHHIAKTHQNESIKLRYSPDSFNALVLKHQSTTLLVYHTGKVVVIAAKDLKRIADIIEKVFLSAKHVLHALEHSI